MSGEEQNRRQRKEKAEAVSDSDGSVTVKDQSEDDHQSLSNTYGTTGREMKGVLAMDGSGTNNEDL